MHARVELRLRHAQRAWICATPKAASAETAAHAGVAVWRCVLSSEGLRLCEHPTCWLNMDRAVWTMTPPCRACAGAASMTACTQDLAACLYVSGAAEHGPGGAWLRVLTLGASLPLQGFELDMVRMPLGQLSTVQVERGYEVLGRVRNALAGLSSDCLVTLSSEFYTIIPHIFKRSRPVRLCVSHLGRTAQSHRGLGPSCSCLPTFSKILSGDAGCFPAATCRAEAPFKSGATQSAHHAPPAQ